MGKLLFYFTAGFVINFTLLMIFEKMKQKNRQPSQQIQGQMPQYGQNPLYGGQLQQPQGFQQPINYQQPQYPTIAGIPPQSQSQMQPSGFGHQQYSSLGQQNQQIPNDSPYFIRK